MIPTVIQKFHTSTRIRRFVKFYEGCLPLIVVLCYVAIIYSLPNSETKINAMPAQFGETNISPLKTISVSKFE